jgi:hypothetical protein
LGGEIGSILFLKTFGDIREFSAIQSGDQFFIIRGHKSGIQLGFFFVNFNGPIYKPGFHADGLFYIFKNIVKPEADFCDIFNAARIDRAV